jgi:hypothetical protein
MINLVSSLNARKNLKIKTKIFPLLRVEKNLFNSYREGKKDGECVARIKIIFSLLYTE